MARWKRVLLCLCVLIVAAIGFILWDNKGGSKPSVSISFIGYTNGSLGDSGQLGVVRMTNSGPVAVYLWGVSHAVVSRDDILRDPDSVTIYPGSGQNLRSWQPQVLEPGKAVAAEIWIAPGFQLWSVDGSISRWRLQERVCKWAYKSGNSTIQGWVLKIAPWSELSTVTFGPITNQIPTSLLPSRNGTEANRGNEEAKTE